MITILFLFLIYLFYFLKFLCIYWIIDFVIDRKLDNGKQCEKQQPNPQYEKDKDLDELDKFYGQSVFGCDRVISTTVRNNR